MNDLYLNELRLQKEKIPQDSYLLGLPIVRALDCLTFSKRVTFFVGENGTGKSTLLEAIAVACGFNPEGGSRNFQFSSRDSHSPLYQALKVIRGFSRPKDGFFLRAESFYNVASYIDDIDEQPAYSSKIIASYGGLSLHKQSHGESFLSLLCNRFCANGLYILDEPEAALSPTGQFAILTRIAELVQQNCQFIIATHSPILMTYPDSDLYLLGEDTIQRTTYDQTEHYQLTKRFLNDPAKILNQLL